MTRFIDTKKLKEFIERNDRGDDVWVKMIRDKLLDFINANQVEGIKGYCKDCKWYRDIYKQKHCLFVARERTEATVNPYGYCSEFEPKEGE